MQIKRSFGIISDSQNRQVQRDHKLVVIETEVLRQRSGGQHRYGQLIFTDGVADCQPEVGVGGGVVGGGEEFAEENRGGDIQGVRGVC